MKTFLLEGNNSYTNRGCEAIAYGTVNILRKHFPDSQILICSRGWKTEEDASFYSPANVKYYPYPRKYFFSWWVRKIKHALNSDPMKKAYRPFNFEPQLQNADVVLTLGGDNWSLDYSTPWYLFDVVDIIKDSKTPLVHWGSSIGPFFDDPEFEQQAAKRLQSYDLLLIRESATIDYLHSIGVGENIRAVADPAFVMESTKPGELTDSVHRMLEEGCFGLNIPARMGPYPSDPEEYFSRMMELVKLLHDLLPIPILLIPHVFGGDKERNNDYFFLEKIVQGLGISDGHLAVAPPELRAPELKWVIGKTLVFAGGRTHSTIAALSSGVPTFFLSYSLKSRGISRDMIGHEDWLLSIKSTPAQVLAERIQTFWNSRDEYRKHLQEVLPSFIQKAWKSGEYLKELI